MPITPKAWANRPSALNPNVGETLADWETRVAAYAAANPGVLTPADAAALIDLETRMGAYADTAVASEASARATAVTAEATARTAADAGKQATSEKAQANGYAGLDGAGKVPKAQLPTLAAADLNADVASQAELDTAVANAQLRSEKGLPNGYAPLNGSSRVPIANLASGTPDGTKFIRDDGTLVTPAGGGGGSGLPATIQNRSANFAAAAGDLNLVDATSAPIAGTLPAGTVGQLITVIKTDASANAVTVTVTGGGTINGDAAGEIIGAQHFGSLYECVGAGAWRRVAATAPGIASVPDASTTVKGSTKLSKAPVVPTSPIALGVNDERTQPQGRTTATPTSENLTGTLTVAYVGAEEKVVRGPLTGNLVLNSSGTVAGSRMTVLAIQDSTPRTVTIDGNAVTPISQVSGALIRIDVEYVDVAGTITPNIAFTSTEVGKDEPVNTVAASGAAQTIPAPTVAPISRITLTANCTLTFPAAAAGRSFTVILAQDATGSRTVTWPTVKWPGGTTPTLTTTATKADAFTFLSADGVNWLGFVSGQNL